MKSRKAGSEPHASQSEPKTYEVGYKKPPVKNRFQPGKSGNPSGRRKMRLSPEDYLSKLMSGVVAVNNNGVSKKVTRIEALVHKMFVTSMKGDTRSAGTIVKILEKRATKEANERKPPSLEILTLEELNFLEKIYTKLEEQKLNEEFEEVRRKYRVKDI